MKRSNYSIRVVGWLLPLQHLWLQASSHWGVAHIIYISLKHAVRHHWFFCKPGVSMMQAHGWESCRCVTHQELSEDRIQSHGQKRPGQPAVTSLTLAETIHLAERGPPWVERNSPDPRPNAHEGRNVYTQADMFHEHTDHRHINKLLWTYMHFSMHVCTYLYNAACQGYFEQSPAQSVVLSTWIIPSKIDAGNRSDTQPSSWTDTNRQL